MKKFIYSLILAVSTVSVLTFANCVFKKVNPIKSTAKPLSASESKSALKKWEETPDGIFFKKWEASSAGLKVDAAASKIRKSVISFSNMQAVVTSLTLPVGSRLGFGLMINIKGEDFILSFGPDLNKRFEHLKALKVNDKITIRSHSISKAPKYSYAIVAGDYVEYKGLIFYKRKLNKGGC